MNIENDRRPNGFLGVCAVTVSLIGAVLPGCATRASEFGLLSESGIVTQNGRQITSASELPNRLVTGDGAEFVKVSDGLCSGFEEKSIRVFDTQYVLVKK